MNLEDKLKTLTIAIVSHIYATGPALDLENFLKNRVRNLIFIGHPFSYARDVRSFYRVYEDGRLVGERRMHAWKLPELLLYIKDVLYTLFWVWRFKQCDLYVGADNLNAFCGLCLKKLGYAKKVVFYAIDYVPNRFNNRVLNRFYHWLDRFCVRHCDSVWNLSAIMAEEREKSGLGVGYRKKQIVVPIGTNNAKTVPFDKINRYHIVFMGHLKEGGPGLEFLIQAMPEIVKKIPKAHLVVIGGGQLEEELKRQVSELNLDRYVEFTGFIEDHREIEDKLAKCAVGVAPYVDDGKTYTRYTDPGKPKAYLAAGLPVIITKVPQVALEIAEKRCGFAIDFKRNELVSAVTRLLSSEKLLKEYRGNAIKFARCYDWNKVFSKALGISLETKEHNG